MLVLSFELGSCSLDSILECGENFVTREGEYIIPTAAVSKHWLSG